MSRKKEGDVLYPKYKVYKEDSGEEVDACFVLRLKDKVARKAILKYADEVDNKVLARELRDWVAEYEELSCINPGRGYCEKVESYVCCAHCKILKECIRDGDIKCYLVEMGEVGNIEECIDYR